MSRILSEITSRKNIVLLGETGSGKTETGIEIAKRLAAAGIMVALFDLDQTKPMFRAREHSDALAGMGVVLHWQEQDLDTPTVADGVIEALCDPERHVILDIGGGSHGSHMIGQFSHILNTDSTEVYYLVNPYRLWSGNADDIRETVQKVIGSAQLSSFSVAANPNLGADTTVETVMDGIKEISRMLPDLPIKFVCVQSSLADQIMQKIDLPVLSISISTTPEWM